MIKVSTTGFHSVFFISPLTCISNECIFVRLKTPRMTFVSSGPKNSTPHWKCRLCVCVREFQKITLFSNVLSEQRSDPISSVSWQIPSRQGICGERERSKSQRQGSWAIFIFAWIFLKGDLKVTRHINLWVYLYTDREGWSHQVTSQSGAI